MGFCRVYGNMRRSIHARAYSCTIEVVDQHNSAQCKGLNDMTYSEDLREQEMLDAKDIESICGNHGQTLDEFKEYYEPTNGYWTGNQIMDWLGY